MQTHYDMIIVGGGMVGASLACALINVASELGLRLAIVESAPLSSDMSEYQPSYDARATALSYGTSKLYQQMGVWTALSERVCAIDQIQVSDQGRWGGARLHAWDEGVPALGYVVENRWLGQTLLDYLHQHPQAERVSFFCPAVVQTIKNLPEGMSVSLLCDDKPLTLTTGLVVLADGGRSSLREQLGINYQETPYGQFAVVATISPDSDHRQIAYERFTPTGPLALLPLQSQSGVARMGLVWTVPEQKAEEVLALDDAAFISSVQAQVGYRAGCFVQVGERFAYPLKKVVADEQVRQGLVVLGNASHTLHPIAGQGYNLALRGVVDLAQQIISDCRAGHKPGALSSLQAYQARRSYDQQRTVGLSERVMQLFSNSNPVLAFGRNAGLQLLDICPAAKTLFARGAMGLDIPAPKLK